MMVSSSGKCLRVEALDEVAVRAELIIAGKPDARHDGHVEDDVDGVGHLDADLGEGGADDAHRIGDDVHRPALHLAAGDVGAHLVCVGGRHPVVGGACVLLVAAADERAVLDAGDVVLRGAVIVAAGEFLLVELDHLARLASLLAERFQLRLAPVDPHDLVGLREGGALLDEGDDLLVLRRISHIFSS